MDHQSKAIVLGVLGLTTVAVFCAYAVSRRKATARAGSAKGGLSPPQLDAGAKGEEAVAAISPALDAKDKSPVLEDKTLSEAVAGVAAAAEAAGVAGYDAEKAKEKAKNKQREAEVATAMEASSQLFNRASANAKKYFREDRFSEAAEQYGIALSHCDDLENRRSQRTALHNNRGAAFEKAGKYAQALSECVLCLAREPEHPLARVRKSRVLDALGRPVDALAEVCAHLLLERDRYQAKIAMNPLLQASPPPPPKHLEPLLQKIAFSRADEILAEREKSDAGKAGGDGGGAQGKTNPKRKPLMKQAVAELLRSFGSYTDLGRRCKNMDEAGVTRELQESGEGEGGDGSSASPGAQGAASRVSALVDRGQIRLVNGDYDGARDDIFEAAQLMSKLQEDPTGGEIGVPTDVEASLWEWQGTFLQLELDADAAMEAYQRCEARLKAEGGREPEADVLIKMAWVHIDKDATDEAKAVFDRAIDLYPDYGSNYAHRARLREGGGDTGAVVTLLDKALQLNPQDVYAREQLCKLYEEAGAIDKALVAAQRGIDAVPNSETLLTLKAGLEFAMAVQNQDMSAASRVGDLFDRAIAAAPASPIAYLNKAMFLLQMMNDLPGAVETIQKGVDADPSNVSALVQLANMKVMMAKTMEDGDVAMKLLERAVTLSVMKEELVETLSVLVATEGRIQAAVLLGRTSLQ